MEVFRNLRPITPFDLAVAAGYFPSIKSIDKFGHAPDCDQNVPTDIWDGADGTLSTDVWVPPTQARTHQITSSSTNDTAAGSGVRTVTIWGLKDWDTPESSESITMDGTNDVATTNDYVIIHRMRAETWGTGGVAAGNITATADTDSTITAAIKAANNQTEMAIYGWSSKEDLYLCGFKLDIYKNPGSGVTVTGDILVMPDPGTNAVNNTAWVNKEQLSMTGDQPSYARQLCVPRKFSGPGIIKFQALVTSASSNINATAVFDAYIVMNT